ncbi:efflux RND transporter permease subunit [Sinorhizobium meliloti]
MPQFFIDRPVFAWVIAIMIVIVGLIAIPQMPVSRYPAIAPPSVSIYATYPGATPQAINDSVTSLIEREISGMRTFDAPSETYPAAWACVTDANARHSHSRLWGRASRTPDR